MITQHPYVKYFGNSADVKPTSEGLNAATFQEIDTGAIYRYDEPSKTWYPQNQDQPTPPKPEQTVDVTITENGDTTILPDEGKTIAQVNLSVAVPNGYPFGFSWKPTEATMKLSDEAVSLPKGILVIKALEVGGDAPEGTIYTQQLTVTYDTIVYTLDPNGSSRMSFCDDRSDVFATISVTDSATEEPEDPDEWVKYVIYTLVDQNGDTVDPDWFATNVPVPAEVI